MHNSSNLKPVKDTEGKIVPGLYRGESGALVVRDAAGLTRSKISHTALETINKELAELKAQVQELMARLK